MVADETTKDVHIAIKDGDAEAGESLEVRLPWYKRYMSWIIGVCLLLVVIAVALGRCLLSCSLPCSSYVQ